MTSGQTKSVLAKTKEILMAFDESALHLSGWQVVLVTYSSPCLVSGARGLHDQQQQFDSVLVGDKHIFAHEPVVHSLAGNTKRLGNLGDREIEMDRPSTQLVARGLGCAHHGINCFL